MTSCEILLTCLAVLVLLIITAPLFLFMIVAAVYENSKIGILILLTLWGLLIFNFVEDEYNEAKFSGVRGCATYNYEKHIEYQKIKGYY